MTELFSSTDFINLSEVTPNKTSRTLTEGHRTDRSWIALVALAFVVVMGAVDVLPFEWVAMGAALLVVAGGCLKKDEMYHAVNWSVITMIIGMLGLGVAMDRTGTAQTIVNWLEHLIGAWDRNIIISVVLLVSIIATELLSNNAVAALFTPLVIQLGADLGIDPRPLVAAVMAGASIGFAVPTGYQTHLLVYSAGGYRFSDFFRIGILVDVLCWVLGSLAIPIIWP